MGAPIAEPSSTVDTVQLPGTNKHVKVWAIVVGAVVGAILVFAIIGGLIWCCWARAAARRDAAAGGCKPSLQPAMLDARADFEFPSSSRFRMVQSGQICTA